MVPHLSTQPTLGEIRQWLIDYVVWQLECSERLHAPGWRLPALFAGHPVGSDVRGDLVFNLGMLHQLGVREVAGLPVAEGISRVLAPIDGPATHSFYSYRIAETLLRFGRFDADNPLLAQLDAAGRDNLAQCCDSTAMISQLGHSLPRNYVAVLARCELGRERLGLVAPSPHLEELVSGVRALLAANPRGYIDDSNDGSGRFDIYMADVYLFTEPLADRLGELWEHGLVAATTLVDLTMTADGSAIPWGRSTGALGVALSIELAALNLGRSRLTDEADEARWRHALLRACRNLTGWFDQGLISSHQHRSTYAYRGPFRRLQMTYDVLGKLLQSAIELDHLDTASLERSVSAVPLPPLDELVRLADQPPAQVWSYRSPQARLVLPLVGGSNADYLPTPRNPGTLEVPVDSPLATGVPVLVYGADLFVPAGPPARSHKGAHRLQLFWDNAAQLRRGLGEQPRQRALQREVEYVVEGATLRVREHLQFPADALPDGITLQLVERRERPLQIEFDGPPGSQVARIDVHGLKEYRSFWGELALVHQLDLRPAADISFGYTLTPRLRIATNARGHHYHRSLYDPIASAVHELQFPWQTRHELGDLDAFFEHVDQFHLHWPEHFLGGHHGAARRVIEALQRNAVRIVWTQHNLLPHRADQRDGAGELYQLWADAADGITHHSASGRVRIRERYRFRADVQERTLAHGHFGNLMAASGRIERAAAEVQLQLTPAAIRVGIVGAPRAEKNVQQLLDAFAACGRADLQLLVTCLSGAEQVPADARITAFPYTLVPRQLYDLRLAAIDVLVFPIEAGELLTTGVVGDAIGAGIPAIVTPWEFLTETLGDAAIRYDGSSADLTRVLDQLSRAQLDSAATAMAALRPRYDWDTIAGQHLDFLRAVGTHKV